MDTVEDAERCVKYLNQSVLEGRYITVEKVIFGTMCYLDDGSDACFFTLSFFPSFSFAFLTWRFLIIFRRKLPQLCWQQSR